MCARARSFPNRRDATGRRFLIEVVYGSAHGSAGRKSKCTSLPQAGLSAQTCIYIYTRQVWHNTCAPTRCAVYFIDIIRERGGMSERAVISWTCGRARDFAPLHIRIIYYYSELRAVGSSPLPTTRWFIAFLLLWDARAIASFLMATIAAAIARWS